MKLSDTVFVVPAYNEEKNLPKLMKDIQKYAKGVKVLIVDDGSTDNTAQISKKLGAITLVHKKNRGKGEGLKTAFRYLKNKKYKKIIIMDADLQFSTKDALKVVEALDDYDFIMGRRDWKKVPFRHALGNFVWRTTFNILYGQRLKDTNCGLIGINKKILNKLEVRGGYIIENMMLASAVKHGIEVGQVPVHVDYHIIHNLPRGSRVVSGVFFFILADGIKYRLSKLFK